MSASRTTPLRSPAAWLGADLAGSDDWLHVLTGAERDDLIDAIAAEPRFHIEMRLEPGEINYLENNAVLHARTAFEDHPEPERKRHMVRLWLTAHGDWADGDDFIRQGIPIKRGVHTDAEDIRASDESGAQ